MEKTRRLRFRSEGVYLPIVTNTVPGGPIDLFYNILNGERTIEEIGRKKMRMPP